MISQKHQAATYGFTLLELLVAIFIFVIVIAAVYSAYFTTNTAVDIAQSQAAINTKARTSLKRMTEDLQSIFLGPGGIFAGKKKEISGRRADMLRFISTAHINFIKNGPPAGSAMIGYSVVGHARNGLLGLYRLDVPYRPGYLARDYSEDKGYLLCDGLRSVQFIYFDKSGNELDGWQVDEGKIKGKKVNFPAMIEIVLHFAEKGQSDLVFKTAVALPSGKD